MGLLPVVVPDWSDVPVPVVAELPVVLGLVPAAPALAPPAPVELPEGLVPASVGGRLELADGSEVVVPLLLLPGVPLLGIDVPVGAVWPADPAVPLLCAKAAELRRTALATIRDFIMILSYWSR